MCGITGILGKEIKDKDKSIRQMTNAISHRGPDDDGFFIDDYLGLGMRRLSIIDLAHGKQPITSFDDRFLIFFNGEIYNYKILREELKVKGKCFKTESDTEVVLSMFEVYGLQAFQYLRGMFVIAIYDKKEHKLILARDFFGIKPLYYLKKSNNIIAFSSEIKSFLALENFLPETNDAAVFNYISFQYNPLEETFFKNIFRLPPAHFLSIDLNTGVSEKKRYWQFEFKQDNSLNESKTAKKILAVMQDSVACHMIADVPVGSFLSGGIDSSIIATLMQKIRGGRKIKTFNVGFDSLSESMEAKETSIPLGTDHHEITIGPKEYFEVLPKAILHFDEPVADPSALGLYFLAKEAAKHVKVVLSGVGSDELFGGYNIYLTPFYSQKLLWVPKKIIKIFLELPFKFFGKNYLRRVSMKLEDWYIGQKYFNGSIFDRKEIEKLWRGDRIDFLSLDSIYRQTIGLSDSTKMQYVDIHTWLIGDILAKADKMTMAHSLELRVQFLDIEVAHLARTLPDRFKWKFVGWHGTTKYLLREAFKNVLPESVRNRKKLGFPTPVKNWFTNERADVYDTILDNPYVKSHMDISYIKKLIDDHLIKKTDNSRKIYLLFVFSLWYNIFIKRQ